MSAYCWVLACSSHHPYYFCVVGNRHNFTPSSHCGGWLIEVTIHVILHDTAKRLKDLFLMFRICMTIAQYPQLESSKPFAVPFQNYSVQQVGFYFTYLLVPKMVCSKNGQHISSLPCKLVGRHKLDEAVSGHHGICCWRSHGLSWPLSKQFNSWVNKHGSWHSVQDRAPS